jgi:hypothetical protein
MINMVRLIHFPSMTQRSMGACIAILSPVPWFRRLTTGTLVAVCLLLPVYAPDDSGISPPK